jgi:peptidoglycan-associated lipoprotein
MYNFKKQIQTLNFKQAEKRSRKMSKRMACFFVMLLCGSLVAGGCAKKEIVKGEEPGAATARPGDETQGARGEAARDQIVKETPIVREDSFRQAGEAVAESAMGKVYFDFDSYLLSQTAQDTLSKNAEYLLKKNTAVKVQIAGNCDERGSDEYNLALGERRAKAALNYLVTLGVPADRLSFISYGKEKPADPGHDDAAWAKNRRDDFFVMK